MLLCVLWWWVSTKSCDFAGNGWRLSISNCEFHLPRNAEHRHHYGPTTHSIYLQKLLLYTLCIRFVCVCSFFLSYLQIRICILKHATLRTAAATRILKRVDKYCQDGILCCASLQLFLFHCRYKLYRRYE